MLGGAEPGGPMEAITTRDLSPHHFTPHEPAFEGMPVARGPLSSWVLRRMTEPEHTGRFSCDEEFMAALGDAAGDTEVALADDDLHLALYLMLELHYRSFDGVGASLEWNPDLLECRTALEDTFLTGLADAVPPVEADPESVGATLFEMATVDQSPSLSRYLERRADLDQFREFVVHRSAYQLKEADPHSWLIPRL